MSGNLLRPEHNNKKVYAWLQNRHEKGQRSIDEDGVYIRNGHKWPVPYGVRSALRTQLYQSQLSHQYPFYVTWISPTTRKRLKKKMMSLPHAIIFIAEKAQYVDPHASIVSKHGFFIPTKLMGKFPRKMKYTDARTHQSKERPLYWCPCCMAPRPFIRTERTFFAEKKFWSEKEQRYEWRNVELAITVCTICGITNRDHKFRASNQPLQKTKVKKGKTRIKRKR